MASEQGAPIAASPAAAPYLVKGIRQQRGWRSEHHPEPMTIAYADPPYVGVAHRYPEKTEVDHVELIARLSRDYPDGWALSASSKSLQALLPLCPADCRVGVWVKRFYALRANVRPPYGWEPVIFRGGRRIRDEYTPDWLVSQSQGQQRVLGQKPEDFCVWLFRMLGMRKGDTLVDLFPGSGAVARAWDKYQGQLELGALRRFV